MRPPARRPGWLGALALLAATAVAAVVAPALAPALARAEERRLTIVHTNDMHGHLLPGPDYLSPGEPKPALGGAAAIAAFAAAEKARAEKEGAGFLMLDAGDFYHGAPEGDSTEGVAIVEVMGLMGYHAAALGNHELAYGVESLKRLCAKSPFPILACNVLEEVDPPEDGGDKPPKKVERRPSYVKPYVIVETGGVKVAIVGLVTDATPRLNLPEHTAGLKFQRPDSALRAVLPEVRRQSDLVILVTHLGSEDDLELAADPQVEGVALIVGGHDHVVLEPAPLVNETLVVQAGEHGRRVGVVSLVFDTEKRRVVGREAFLVNLPAGAPQAAAVAEAVEKRRIKDLDVPIAECREPVARSYRGESPAGDLVCDALREALGADLAILNHTTVRGGFGRGPVTRRDVYACVPFQNKLARLDLTGRELVELLEAALASMDPNLEVSGIEIRYDPGKPRLQRAVEVRVGGRPIDYERTYKVATTDFFAARTDRYRVLRGKEPKLDPRSPYDVLCEYLAKRSPVTRPSGYRLQAVAAPQRPGSGSRGGR